jgi:small subunit ribosomal protein S9
MKKARRKNAVALITVVKGNGDILINNKLYTEHSLFLNKTFDIYGGNQDLKRAAKEYNISIKISGGGVISQRYCAQKALACKLLSLAKGIPNFYADIKNKRLLRSDMRIKERRKYGLKKARRAPQSTKR